jgi:alpha-beta hydrolase superfamily lysophospholipase
MNTPRVSLHKIYSTDGIELDSILFEPIKKTKKIIIHVHGKEGHFVQNHFVSVMGNTYPESGYAFLTFNNRGHDYMADLLKKSASGFEWTQGGSMFDTIEDFSLDINGIIHYVKSLGYSEIILQGHSIGPHKICYYITHEPRHGIAKIILLSTADTQYLFDAQVVDWRKYSLYAKKLISENKGTNLMPVHLWSDCPVSANTFWNYTKPDNNLFVFNFSHPKEQFKNFDHVTLPILVVNPENDFSTDVPQQEAMKMLQQHTISKKFEMKIIPNAIHNFLSKEDELIQAIVSWLKK